MPFRVAARAGYLVAICWRAFVCDCCFCLCCCFVCFGFACLWFFVRSSSSELQPWILYSCRLKGIAEAATLRRNIHFGNLSESHLVAEIVFFSAHWLIVVFLHMISHVCSIHNCIANCSLQHVWNSEVMQSVVRMQAILNFAQATQSQDFEFRPGSEFCQGSEALKGKYARQLLYES